VLCREVLRTVLFLISILACCGKQFRKVSGWLGRCWADRNIRCCVVILCEER
jgi:hypothetical protein